MSVRFFVCFCGKVPAEPPAGAALSFIVNPSPAFVCEEVLIQTPAGQSKEPSQEKVLCNLEEYLEKQIREPHGRRIVAIFRRFEKAGKSGREQGRISSNFSRLPTRLTIFYPERMNHNQDEFAQLFPTLEGEELEEARENFDRYLATVCRIHERIRRDPEAQRRLRALTGSRNHDTIQGRSNRSLTQHSK